MSRDLDAEFETAIGEVMARALRKRADAQRQRALLLSKTAIEDREPARREVAAGISALRRCDW